MRLVNLKISAPNFKGFMILIKFDDKIMQSNFRFQILIVFSILVSIKSEVDEDTKLASPGGGSLNHIRLSHGHQQQLADLSPGSGSAGGRSHGPLPDLLGGNYNQAHINLVDK